MASNVRLEAILSMLRPCDVLLDVGTDHALLPVLAVRGRVARKAIAADLRERPLDEARRTVARYGLVDRIHVVQADGLRALESLAADAVVIAGMGGALIRRVCEDAPKSFECVTQLVLQPNYAPEHVRGWAREHGWHLREECMIHTNGQYYTLCAFVRGIGADPSYATIACPDAVKLEVGPLLLQRKDPLAKRYCDWQKSRLVRVRAKVIVAPERLEAALKRFETACAYLA